MRSSTVLTALAASNLAYAFPNMDALTAPLQEQAYRRVAEMKRSVDATAAAPPQGAGALPNTPPPFNAKDQYVSTTGKYAFVAPGPGDARGECPGLNAMANHGYLPHNGVATIAQFTTACQQVFGMGVDLAAFLAVFGAAVDGDGTSWSIEGGPHVGIAGSHGNYEADSSPFKADLYQYGDVNKLVLSQFKTLYDMQPDASTANYNLEVFRDFRAQRFNESIAKNPYFAYEPFSGMAVSQAAFTFIYRFMANHTAEAPEGILNQEVLKSFHSISGPDNNQVWTYGHERIPDNWYRRSQLDAYTIPYFIADIGYFAQKYPQVVGIGCNQGKVNTYNAFSAETLSNGAYTAKQALANPFCFAVEFAKVELPLQTGLGSALSPLLNSLNNVTSALNCASIGSVNMTALTACPGFALYDGPTAPVAPGAIQS